MMGPSIVYLLKEQYNAIETKIERNIYICTDTHEVFKGENLVQDVIVYANAQPENPSSNVVYCINKNLFLWDGSEWINVTQVIIDQVEIALDPAKHVTKEQLKDAIEDVEDEVPTLSFDGLYEKVKAAGYVGTKSVFVAQLAEVLNATENIVVNEESNVKVVKIGDVEYSSMSEAFDAVQDGDVITMERNAVLDAPATLAASNVTLDFAGKMIELDNNSLTVSGSNVVLKNVSFVDNSDLSNPSLTSGGLYINDGATVTIEDSDFDSRTDAVINVEGGAQLILKDCVIDSSLDPDYAAAKYDSKPLVMVDNATLTVLGGEIIADTSSDLECGLYPISAWNGCTIVLGDANTHEGPTVIGNSACIGSNNTAHAVDNIVIHGGNYKSLMTHPQWMGVIYAGDSANIDIDGGVFDGGDYDIALPYVPATYKVNITDGEFNGGVVIKKDYKSGGSGPEEPDEINITGGIYANIVPEEFIAPGFGCAKRSDGRYMIVAINTPNVEFVAVSSQEQSGTVETPAGPEAQDEF